jgi:iron complex outermembrane receptor protein
MQRHIRITLSRTTLGLFATLPAALPPAQAQAQAISAGAATETPQRVEVTGSRIRQVDLETAQPVQVMTQEQIQKTGLVTVGEIINNLSVAGTPAFSRGSTLGASREQGGQFINMRNLGANRLLVLVDGKRWTTTVAGYTDVSTIPSAFIERIEILKDGASAIYGSDAIAGVVNFILKKSVQGGQASVYTGRNELGDGRGKDLSLSYGAGNERASIMFGLSYSELGAVWAKDREVTATTNGPAHLNSGFGQGAWGRIRQVAANGFASGFNQYLNHTGSYDGSGAGSDSRNRLNYHTYANADADLFNSTQQMMFTSPTRLTTLFTKGSIALPQDTRLTVTAMLADRLSSRQVAGYPLNSQTQLKFPVYIDRNSYYNPYGSQGIGAAAPGQDLFFYRRTIEVPRVSENENRTLHVDAVLEGGFSLLDKPWTWNLGYNHSTIHGDVRSTGNLNLLNLKKALGPSFRNAGGVVQCGTPAAPILLTDCVPFDILGGPSASTAAALDYVMSVGQATYGSTVNSATADITGELLTLPAGALAVAAGLEHRAVRGEDRPGQFEQSGYSSDLAGNTTLGKYSVREAYLEFNIPLLKDLPLLRSLALDIASRYSDYSNFGSTTNSKASLLWKPVRALLVRATYAEGFRAPALADSFGSGSQGYDSYLDACDSLYGEAARTPAVKARCSAAGVPVTFRQVNQAGAPVPASGAQTPVPFDVGIGNGALQPETATTRTLGLVYSPSWLSGMSVALDWFDIRVKNRITTVSAVFEINQCYIDNVQAFCDRIRRDPATGQIASLSRGTLNLGELATKGIDLSLAYRLPRTGLGQFNIRTETTYVDKYDTRSTVSAAPLHYAGEYGYNRVKSNLALDWSLGNWSATLASRYYSKIKVHCWSAPLNQECSNPNDKTSWGTGYNRLGAMVYSDLSIGYALPWKARLLAGANNVFNRKPTIVYDAGSALGGASSSSAVDPERPIDRFFYVRYNQSF